MQEDNERYFKELKESHFEARILFPTQLPFSCEVEIKIFRPEQLNKGYCTGILFKSILGEHSPK